VLYGCGATRYTCPGDLEADATSIRKWKDTKSSNNIYYQIFAVLQRPRAGQQRRVVNMFELPLCAAKAYGKPPPEGQKRILQADQADGLSGIKGKNHKGLKTLLISDGARCYPKLARKKSLLHRACSHSKGIFSRNKRLPTRGWTKIHTGNIDGFWKGAKKAIPDSLPSQKKEQTERQFVEVPQTLPMALGMHGEKHHETYSRDLEELVNSPEVTRRVFGAKVL